MNNKAIDKINGFFKAFEWINHKTNFGYTFEIKQLPKFSEHYETIDYYLKNHLSGTCDLSISTVNLGNSWRISLKEYLLKWLFEFQTGSFFDAGCLTDIKNTFSLSCDSEKKQMVEELLNDIESVADFIHGYEVKIYLTNSFYENEYNDFLLLGKDGSLFIHLGVSD